jgi:transcription initiation factor TFIIB
MRRSGAPLRYTEFDQGLGTTIGNKQDLYALKGKDRYKFNRLKQWQNRVSTSLERNLKMALAELKRVSSFLQISGQVEEEAARLYTLAVQKNLVRGRAMEAVVAGCLYAACRRYEIPRNLDEFAVAVGMEKKDIGRTYRFVARELSLKILPSDPLDYLPKLISTLKLDPKTQSLAADLIQQTQAAQLTSGRTPNGIAAAAVYVAALINGVRKTQRSVADAACITEVTIRNRYKEMEGALKLKELIRETKRREHREKDMKSRLKNRKKAKDLNKRKLRLFT